MNQVRSLLRIMAALAALLIISGCWSSREIEELSVYVGLGLDVGEETAFEKTSLPKGQLLEGK